MAKESLYLKRVLTFRCRAKDDAAPDIAVSFRVARASIDLRRQTIEFPRAKSDDR
jgi:hypothetical protein